MTALMFCRECDKPRPDTHEKCPECGCGDPVIGSHVPRSIPGHIPDLTYARTGRYIAECSCGEFLETERFTTAVRVLRRHILGTVRASEVRHRRATATRHLSKQSAGERR